MALDVPTLGLSSLQSYSILVAVAAIVFTAVTWWASDDRPYSGFKLVGKERGEWGNTKAKQRYITDATKILKRGLEECHGNAFQVIGSNGPIIVLRPRFVEEIRSHPDLSFSAFNDRDFFADYPGFEPFREGNSESNILQTVARKNLSQAIGGMTESLSQETTQALQDLMPTQKDWTGIKFSEIAPQIIARLSAKLFLGEPICRDKKWLDISVNYTTDVFYAARKLRSYPSYMRPFVYRFLPEVRTIQKHRRDAREIIEPEVAARRRTHREAQGKRAKSTDAVGWMEDVSAQINKPFDIVSGQLFFIIAAIHTTSTTIVGLLYDLAANPQYITDLREEIVQVLREDGGWKKTSLYKMKLLDSCMKESQRLHAVGAVLMGRRALRRIVFSDGTSIPKGAYLAVPTFEMVESDRWGADKETFNGRRFLDLRGQPGQENRWQFVTTSAEHFGFGHGQHACPGRFFASNEIKIAAAHLLLKYDFALDGPPPASVMGSEYVPDPGYVMRCRPRQPEMEL